MPHALSTAPFPAGLEANRDAFDLMPGLPRFHSPSIEQLQQCVLVHRGLRQWREPAASMSNEIR
jgi:hypothetical protein